MLSKSDTKELGWVIGDRNRLAAWQRCADATPTPTPLRGSMTIKCL